MKQRNHSAPFNLPGGDLLEVLDQKGDPLMFMPQKQVLSHALPHRYVLVAVRNKEDKVYLKKTTPVKKNLPLWSLSASGCVMAGEAIEDAAHREMQEKLGISGLYISPAALDIPGVDSTGALTSLFISQPSHIILNPGLNALEAGMFVDADELSDLIHSMPEYMDQALIWAASTGKLFPK